jgi:tRNA (mo5U34)-methyltransferase
VTKEELQAAVDAVPYWYHRIDLPYGIVTPGWAPIDPAAYRIPDDLAGKTVLDVGAWDGYWTFEAVKRGAAVVAIDDFSDTVGSVTNADRSKKWRTFNLCREALGLTEDQCCTYDTSVYNLPKINAWNPVFADTFQACTYDCIFLFGVLYHLRSPLLALEILRDYCDSGGTIHIETAILDGCKSAYSDRIYTAADCAFEFFPHDEYGLNHSNWWVGTLRGWCGLVEAAGFKNIEHWKLTDNPRNVSETRGFIRASV